MDLLGIVIMGAVMLVAQGMAIVEAAIEERKRYSQGKFDFWMARKVARVLDEVDPVIPGQRRKHSYEERLYACGKLSDVAKCADGGHKIDYLMTCHLGFCPNCNEDKAKKTFARVSDRLGLNKGPVKEARLITLTIKTTGDLVADLAHLKESWEKFRNHARRKQPEWLKSGVSAIEMGSNGNVHIHLAQIDGGYIRQGNPDPTSPGYCPHPAGMNSFCCLTEAWKHVTGGDSYVTDIRSMPGEDAVRYLIKYIVKGVKLDGSDGKGVGIMHAVEWYLASKGSNLINFFGDAYSKGSSGATCPVITENGDRCASEFVKKGD